MIRKEKTNSRVMSYSIQRSMIGDRLHFAGSEAFKLLRTNIEFCTPDEDGCRVIGITSGMSGEGKSITAINLACSLAEAGHRVLLTEADMRQPSLAKRIRISNSPGLSNLLARKCRADEVLRESGILPNLVVITGGDVPPNPSELLGSDRMNSVIKVLSEKFDYIILDLPPVNVVSDALVVSGIIDGMAVVVRKDYATRKSVANLVSRLEFRNIRILGFVMVRINERGRIHRKKKVRPHN